MKHMWAGAHDVSTETLPCRTLGTMLQSQPRLIRSSRAQRMLRRQENRPAETWATVSQTRRVSQRGHGSAADSTSLGTSWFTEQPISGVRIDGHVVVFCCTHALRVTLEEEVPVTCRSIPAPWWTNQVHDSHRVLTGCTPREVLEGRAIDDERCKKPRPRHGRWFISNIRRFLSGATDRARWTSLFEGAQHEGRSLTGSNDTNRKSCTTSNARIGKFRALEKRFRPIPFARSNGTIGNPFASLSRN